MISIIVIGRNEGWRLTKCLQSIYNIFTICQIEFEVIYIDSDSTDESLERALFFEKIKIFKIIGQSNAAVARNVGAAQATGDILFFVDGDMEVQADFFKYIFNKNNQLLSAYVTGHLDDYFYDDNETFISKSPRTYNNILPKNAQVLTQNGGIYLITKKEWDEVGGMNTKFRINEDLDLTIRLRKKKVKMVRLPHLICLHHTINYRNKKRMWKMLLSGCEFYPGLILREHLFDRVVIKRFARTNYTAIILMLILIFFNLSGILFFYLSILICRSFIHTCGIKSKTNKIRYFFERLMYQFLADISCWVGFFIFFPKKIIPKYERIN